MATESSAPLPLPLLLHPIHQLAQMQSIGTIGHSLEELLALNSLLLACLFSWLLRTVPASSFIHYK